MKREFGVTARGWGTVVHSQSVTNCNYLLTLAKPAKLDVLAFLGQSAGGGSRQGGTSALLGASRAAGDLRALGEGSP